MKLTTQSYAYKTVKSYHRDWGQKAFNFTRVKL